MIEKSSRKPLFFICLNTCLQQQLFKEIANFRAKCHIQQNNRILCYDGRKIVFLLAAGFFIGL